MARNIGVVGVVFALALTLTACGGGGDADSGNVRDKIVQELTTGKDALDQKSAECITDAIVKELGADKLAELYNDNPSEPPQEVVDAVTTHALECIDLSSLTSTTGG